MPTMTRLLATHPFLHGLSPLWLEPLAGHARQRAWRQGQRMFRQGEPADSFWLLRSGRVALDMAMPGRGDVVTEYIDPPDVLGWSWLFAPYRWHFGAVAIEQSSAIEFDAPGIRDLIADNPALGRDLTNRFTQVLIDRLQAAQTQLTQLYAWTPPQPATSTASTGEGASS
jgi:CRP/FNR family transcriptional regulator, cyclic AMP receptor protein